MSRTSERFQALTRQTNIRLAGIKPRPPFFALFCNVSESPWCALLWYSATRSLTGEGVELWNSMKGRDIRARRGFDSLSGQTFLPFLFLFLGCVNSGCGEGKANGEAELRVPKSRPMFPPSRWRRVSRDMPADLARWPLPAAREMRSMCFQGRSGQIQHLTSMSQC